jgi:N-acetylglucosamine-6-sulfatase
MAAKSPGLARRAFLSSTLALPWAAATGRPNIVFILVDDLRWDELRCTGHPFALSPNADRLAREGANFRNAFATTPLCSPSRASFLTGKYPHRHGIIDNADRSKASHKLVTWPRLLHDEGYETSFVGKWHMGIDDSPRPGFDHWVSFPGQGECVNPVLNVNGKSDRAQGYITDLLTEHALEFLNRPRSRPFCLYLAHKAIHPNITQFADGSVSKLGGDAEDFIPAERHRTLYRGMTPPRRANYSRGPHDQPALEQKIPGVEPLGPKTLIDDETILNRLRMAKAVDESLGQILMTLERRGELDQTAVIFTSDHGYFYGEHYLGHERRLAYEETIRIPMLIRYPAMFRAGSRPKDFFLRDYATITTQS